MALHLIRQYFASVGKRRHLIRYLRESQSLSRMPVNNRITFFKDMVKLIDGLQIIDIADDIVGYTIAHKFKNEDSLIQAINDGIGYGKHHAYESEAYTDVDAFFTRLTKVEKDQYASVLNTYLRDLNKALQSFDLTEDDSPPTYIGRRIYPIQNDITATLELFYELGVLGAKQ